MPQHARVVVPGLHGWRYLGGSWTVPLRVALSRDGSPGGSRVPVLGIWPLAMSGLCRLRSSCCSGSPAGNASLMALCSPSDTSVDVLGAGGLRSFLLRVLVWCFGFLRACLRLRSASLQLPTFPRSHIKDRSAFIIPYSSPQLGASLVSKL